MVFSTLFFDLDATLYPASNGLWDQIRLRIYSYMGEVVGIPKEEIPKTRDLYWTTYGTTLEGLRIHHRIDPQEYLNYVHDLPLESYLQPDPQLGALLESLPQELWVFTNADHNHAARVLDRLGISGAFSGIIDLFALNFQVKPNPEAYRIALDTAGQADPSRCVLFDDLLPNLLAARQLGFTTALVGEMSRSDEVDFQVATLHHLRQVMPGLWNMG